MAVANEPRLKSGRASASSPAGTLVFVRLTNGARGSVARLVAKKILNDQNKFVARARFLRISAPVGSAARAPGSPRCPGAHRLLVRRRGQESADHPAAT